MMKDPIIYHPELLASKGQRFGNLVIDLIFRLVLLFLLGIFAGILMLFGFDGLFIWTQNIDPWTERLVGWGLMVVYYLIMEIAFQRTIGKLITGTKVVAEDGSKPTASMIALRTLCRLIPLEAFSFFGETGRGWHDSISHTYVVDIKRYNAAVLLQDSFEEIGSGIKY